MSEENCTQLTVKLGSNEPAADPLVVAKTMTAMDSLIKEAHNSFENNSELLLKARPFKKGSFEIPFEIILVSGLTLTQPLILSDIIKILKEFFEIKKLLKGTKPDIINNSTILVQGSHINVEQATLNFLSPSNTSGILVSKAFEKIQQDGTIENVDIVTHSNIPLININRKEFEYYKAEKIIDSPGRLIRERVTADVLAPVLNNSSKWVFGLKGKKIHAKVTDDVYTKQVKKREKTFANGDRLDIDLEWTEYHSHDSDSLISKDYVVTKIWDHIQPTEDDQLLLFE